MNCSVLFLPSILSDTVPSRLVQKQRATRVALVKARLEIAFFHEPRIPDSHGEMM